MTSGLAVFAGCGSNHRPPPAGDPSYTPSGGGGANGGGFGDGGPKVPLCTNNDGSYCDCVDVPLFTDAPNMYFVLDRSGSMASDGKWDQVRVTMASIVRALGPRANFGATVFPGYGQEQCSPPVEILPVRPGDPPGNGDGPTTNALIAGTNTGPNGGTPTAEALRFVLPKLRALSGKSFVILATDGGPNCNASAGCGYTECQPNIEDAPGCPKEGPLNCCEPPTGYRESCLDDGPTTAAVGALKTAGFPTYVIGIPGSAPYAAVLDGLAVAGGTALGSSPKYYAVGANGSTDLLTTLKKIAAKIVATCEFTLTETPADPNLVNVYFDEVVLPKDNVNGWKLEGNVVTLLGTACNRVMDGDVLGVRIVAGCPTVAPR
ncbi:CglB [Labilithrix luteola]|uniref:CglB n=1 Tax=Labilithrix luteola TaxID=1391654 RepID=A0A0K1PVK4_9BACT|nr:CglB [Labilithrix luteola]